MTLLFIWKFCFIPLFLGSFFGLSVANQEKYGPGYHHAIWPKILWALLLIWVIFFTIRGVFYA